MKGKLRAERDISASAEGSLAHLGSPSAFTPRALFLGALFSFFIGAGVPYASFYLQGSFMALGFSTVVAVFLLFFLTGLINPLLKSLHRSAPSRDPADLYHDGHGFTAALAFRGEVSGSGHYPVLLRDARERMAGTDSALCPALADAGRPRDLGFPSMRVWVVGVLCLGHSGCRSFSAGCLSYGLSFWG